MTAPPGPIEVLLLEKSRFRRTLSITLDGAEHFIEYRGDGSGFESAFLDGYEVVRHPSVVRMAPLFEFALGPHAVRLEVTCGLGMSILGPLWPGNLRRFALLVDGKILYEDRLGRQVDPSIVDVL